MLSEKLLDALSDIDDTMIAETNPFSEEEVTTPLLRVSGNGKKGGRKMRRTILLVAACAVLMFSAVAAYAATGGNLLSIFKTKAPDGETETVVEYNPIEQAVVPMSALRGEIQTAPAEIQQQVDAYNALPEMQRYALSTMPEVLSKSFAKVDDAIAYIGYDQLNYPNLAYPTEQTYVDMYGCEAANGYSLAVVTLNTTMKYSVNPDYYCQSITTFFTENAGESNALRLSLTEREALATEQREVNGRTFSFLYMSGTEDGNNLLGTDVFTTDNNVVFMFHVNYTEANRAEAEAVIEEWIAGFSH